MERLSHRPTRAARPRSRVSENGTGECHDYVSDGGKARKIHGDDAAALIGSPSAVD
jgi:hypothetical protein